MKAKSGVILDSRICMAEDSENANLEAETIKNFLAGQPVHQVHDWEETLQDSHAFENCEDSIRLGEWLNVMFGR